MSTVSRASVSLVLLSIAIIISACNNTAGTNQAVMSAQGQPATRNQATRQPQVGASSSEPQLIRKADFGGWGYTAYRATEASQSADGDLVNAGDIIAKVEYVGSDTADGTRNYAAANRSQIAKLTSSSGQVEVLINFRTYLSPDEFRTWAKTYSLVDPRSQLMAISDPTKPNGYIVAHIRPTNSDPDPLPQTQL